MKGSVSHERIFIWAPEVPFFCTRIWALLPKVPIFTCPEMPLWVPKQKFFYHFYKSNNPSFTTFGLVLSQFLNLGFSPFYLQWGSNPGEQLQPKPLMLMKGKRRLEHESFKILPPQSTGSYSHEAKLHNCPQQMLQYENPCFNLVEMDKDNSQIKKASMYASDEKISCLCVFSGSHYMLFQEVARYPKQWWRRSRGKDQEFLRIQRPMRKEGRPAAPSWWWSSLRRPTERKQNIQTWGWPLVPLLQQTGTSCTDTVSGIQSTWWCPPNPIQLFWF